MLTGALRVAAAYAVVASAWILVSDSLLAALPLDDPTRTSVGLLKGWGFVAVTGLLLFGVVLARERSRAGEREAHAASEATLRRFAHLVEHSPLAIMVTDVQGTVLEWNPAAERLWGLAAHEAIGTFAPWVLLEDREAFGGLLREVAAGRVVAGAIRRRRRADGSEVTVRTANAPLEDAGGERRVLFMAEDVTAQVAAEAGRRRSLDRLAALHAIDRAILELRSLEELAGIADTHLRRELGVERVVIGILERDPGWVTLYTTRSDGPDPAAPAQRMRTADLPSPGMRHLRETVVWPDLSLAGPDLAGLAPLAAEGFSSGMVTPLLDHGALVGLIGLMSRAPRTFEGDDLETVVEIADQLAIAVRQVRDRAELGRRAVRLAGMHAIDMAILATTSVTEVAGTAAAHLRSMLQVDRVTVARVDLERASMTVVGVAGTDPAPTLPVTIPLPPGSDARALSDPAVQLHPDVVAAAADQPSLRTLVAQGFVSAAHVPMVYQGQVIGHLGIHSRTPREFTADEVETMVEIGRQLAIALRDVDHRQELERRASRLAHLRLIDLAILEAADTAEMLRRAGVEVRATTGADLVFVAEYDVEAGVGVARLVDGVVPGAVQTGDRYPLAAVLTPALLAAPAPVEIADLQAGEPPQPFMARLAANGIRSVAFRPLVSSGRLVGSLGLGWLRPGAITHADREVLDEVADALAVGVHEARLRRDLAEREARIRAILDGSPSPILAVDRSGTITFANPAAARTFRADGDLPGRPVGDLVPEQDREGHAEFVARFFAELPGAAAVHRFGAEARRLDGSTFPATIDLAPIADTDGAEVIVMIADLSERVALERQLSQAQRMEILGQFAGILAHDVRNYIAAIGWAADTLARDLPAASPLHDDVVLIERAVGEARAMVGSVLEYAKPEPSGGRLRLAEHLDRIGGILARLLGPSIVLEKDIEPDLPEIGLAAGSMTQVLVNLAVNARDAITGDGRLLISARAMNVAIGDATDPLPPGPYVEVRVSDSGSGMDQATADRAFEAFYTTRADDPRGGGTGLGLASVYLLISRARGSVRVESEPGRGTTFTILLPAANAAEGVDPPASG